MAEAEVRDHASSAPVAPVPVPNMPSSAVGAPGATAILDKYRSRLGMNVVSGAQALSACPVNMTLGGMVDLTLDSKFQDACKPLQALFSGGGENGAPVTANVTSDMPKAHGLGYAAVTAKRPALSANAQVASLINVGINPPVMASAHKGPVLETFTVGMPKIWAKINAGRNGSRSQQMHLDTGTSFSCISQSAYDHDFEYLKGAGGTPVMLEPLQLNMFNSHHSIVTHMMQGMTLQKGIAEYTVDLLVVPDTQFDYLLGANFQAEYAVKPYFNKGTVELGCAKIIAGQRVPQFQTVLMIFQSGLMRLPVKTPSRYK